MKSLKLMLLTGAIIISNQITAMHTEAITGKGVTATAGTDKKPSGAWTRTGGSKRAPGSNLTPDLPTVLSTQDKDKKQSGSSSSDSSASPKTTGIAAPTSLTVIIPAAAEAPKPTLPGSPKTTATHCVSPKAPAARVVVLASPRDLFADAEIVTGRRSPSPVRCGAGCGAGSGPSASDDGYDSDKSIHGIGSLLPKLGLVGVVYRRSALKEACMTGSTHFFDKVIEDLRKGNTPLSTEVDKAVADAEEFPDRYNIKQVIELNQLLDQNKFAPSKEAQGSLYNMLNQRKKQLAKEITGLVKEKTANLRAIKKAEFDVARRYSLMNGPCHESPRKPYGISRRSFDSDEKADLATIEQAFKVSARPEKATGK